MDGEALAAVADDLTGAAELAAVGWRRGLTAEVLIEPRVAPRASLAVLDTDSRTRSVDEARARSRRAGEWLLGSRPGLVYKKVDSVLRGWVKAETEELLRTLERPRALLVPANPGLGRVVRDGRYLVEGRPVHETDFARDPLHPVRSSDVREMLGSEGSVPVQVERSDGPVSLAEGLTLGEASSREDLKAWAERVDGTVLGAGGAEFFDALLESRGLGLRGHLATPSAPPTTTRLVVSGTTADRSREALRRAREKGIPVHPLPESLASPGADPDGPLRTWGEEAVRSFSQSPVVAVTLGGPILKDPAEASRLEGLLAGVVARVLDGGRVSEVMVEGGATAAAVIRRLGWTRLQVLRELAPGVVSLLPDAPQAPSLTMKPGSYAWPETVWR